MATAERDLDRSPTPSTSLLPVGCAHRKLNGHHAWSADDDVAETSFAVGRGDRVAPVAGTEASDPHVDHVCVPTTSRETDYVELTQPAGACASAAVDRCYLDTKGAADNHVDRCNGVCHDSQRGGAGSEAGSPTSRSLLATGSRSAYARVADKSSLPPEVEQLRRNCVISVSSSADAQHAADKFA